MDKEQRAMELIKQFHAQNKKITVGLFENANGYALRLDYSFSNLDGEQQKRGREELNTLLTALRGLGLPVYLELGYV